jgi:DNA-directed RNA polymerase sigma subunit (sigma70/sigma32)
MEKGSRNWKNVMKNLDKEFPEPVMNEVFQLEYEPDLSITDIEIADMEMDVVTMINSIDKPRIKKVIEDRYLNNLTLGEVAKHFDVSITRIRQMEWQSIRMIRARYSRPWVF